MNAFSLVKHENVLLSRQRLKADIRPTTRPFVRLLPSELVVGDACIGEPGREILELTVVAEEKNVTAWLHLAPKGGAELSPFCLREGCVAESRILVAVRHVCTDEVDAAICQLWDNIVAATLDEGVLTAFDELIRKKLGSKRTERDALLQGSNAKCE